MNYSEKIKVAKERAREILGREILGEFPINPRNHIEILRRNLVGGNEHTIYLIEDFCKFVVDEL